MLSPSIWLNKKSLEEEELVVVMEVKEVEGVASGWGAKPRGNGRFFLFG